MNALSMPGLPQDAGGPVFSEPWEAKAFAMTLRLHERGLFTWPEWAQALAEQAKLLLTPSPAFYNAPSAALARAHTTKKKDAAHPRR